ncbi:hypothetical protein EOD39_16701 [Acipenser ruthenus]|uniref:Gasdermin PUB domain-containing protein n=1 Tax=Acipenser ruthenus TaxID=7906 RepID=A0A444V5A6_ACIRT|nr:hypothetical protein EOD39_16701 [Acipenser ruthenus]
MEGGRMEEIVCEEDTVLACKAVQFTISTTDEFSNRRFFETIAVSEDFKSLKRYIQREFSGFTSLNQSHRAEIWSLLSELLLHNEALTVLDSIMEKTERGDGEKLSLDMLDEELRGPVQRLLDYRGTSNTEIFSLVMSFISMLDVLSGQTVDLICGLDMKTLREQLELVEIVLQLADGSLSFCDSNWTNKYSEDSLSLVRELLTSCSLNMCDEEPTLVFKISSKQIPALYAMYSTLYVIYILNMK